MEQELAELLERTRFIETINQLFIGTDQRDWLRVKECFAPSVTSDMSSLGAGPPTQMTPADICKGWEEGLKPLKAIHHQAGNYIVRVRGNKAEAFCYGIAMHYLPNKTDQNTRTFVGSYDFELAKDADRWTTTRFKFNLKYIDGNLNLEAS